jgi:oxygen-independent coproporphyrinogen-3 oxidase
MCRFETSWDEQELNFGELHNVLDRLKEIEADGLLELGREKLRVRKEGQAFIRNICMAFDLRLQRSKPETQLFSMTI